MSNRPVSRQHRVWLGGGHPALLGSIQVYQTSGRLRLRSSSARAPVIGICRRRLTKRISDHTSTTGRGVPLPASLLARRHRQSPPRRRSASQGLLAALISVVIIGARGCGHATSDDLQHHQQRDLRGQQLRASFPQAIHGKGEIDLSRQANRSWNGGPETRRGRWVRGPWRACFNSGPTTDCARNHATAMRQSG